MEAATYGPIVNLLDVESRTFTRSVGAWETVAGNELWRSTGVADDLLGVSALGVRAQAETTAFAVLYDVPLPSSLRRNPLRFHCLVRVTETANVNIALQITSDPTHETETGDGNDLVVLDPVGNGPLVRADEWVLLSVTSDVTAANDLPFDPATATIAVTATWDSVDPANNLYVGQPAICVPATVVDNVSAIEAFMRLPEYIRDADAESVDPDYSLFRFIDVLLSGAHDVNGKWTDYRYIPPEVTRGLEKASTLAQPEVADLAALYWLAQLVGVDLIDPRTGLTSWDALMTAADAPPNGDGDGSPAWEEWVDAVDTPVDGTMEWSEIEGFDVDNAAADPTSFLDFIRWQVVTAAYGMRAGTTESLSTIVERGLKPNSTFTLERHADGDPWKIRVTVNEVDVIGGAQDTVEELLAPSVPAGYEVVVDMVAAP